jgi:hypothetical protein
MSDVSNIDTSNTEDMSDFEILAEEVKAFVDRRFAAAASSDAAKIDALLDATKAMSSLVVSLTAAVAQTANVLAAPKTIITDENGKPIGVKPELPN